MLGYILMGSSCKMTSTEDMQNIETTTATKARQKMACLKKTPLSSDKGHRLSLSTDKQSKRAIPVEDEKGLKRVATLLRWPTWTQKSTSSVPFLRRHNTVNRTDLLPGTRSKSEDRKYRL